MTVRVLLESKVKPKQTEALVELLKTNLSSVRHFTGCSQVKVLFDQDKREMLFDEMWESPQHHQNYIESISKSGVMAALVGFLEAPPTVKYLYLSEL